MVIRNAKLRMNGQEVGDRKDEVDLERLRWTLVRLLDTGLRNDLLQAREVTRRSNRLLI